MFLKFSISFLFCILAISCTNAGHKRKASHSDEPVSKTEEELKDEQIIEKAFENCKEWMSLELYFVLDRISELNYESYMGDTPADWALIRTYLVDHVPKGPKCHCLELFTDLFKTHCKISGVPVKIFAEEREAAVKIKGLYDGKVMSE